MGFFDRTKKVKKGGSSSPPQARPLLSSQPEHHVSSVQLPPASPPQQWNTPPYQPAPAFRPAGLLPAPVGWNSDAQPPPPYQPAWPPYAPPMIVNQHYYFNQAPPPPLPLRPHTSSAAPAKLDAGGLDPVGSVCPVTGFPHIFSDASAHCHGHGCNATGGCSAVYDQLSTSFDALMTSIDREDYSVDDQDLFVLQPEHEPGPTGYLHGESASRSITDRGASRRTDRRRGRDTNTKGQTSAVATSLISTSCFAKVELYANSRLPLDLPPLRLYIPTYPLLCLAAQFSERAYEKPRGAEREAHLDADWRNGTKAMVIKSVPMDHMNTIVFAIRGTATFMDWVVNLNMAPASPGSFLDDPGNLCHAGFLSVARGMIKPVAARLRSLLEEDPSRASYSLLITGHSAGGAVASLLYAHMLATSRAARSELNLLAGCFRRIHCVTFGTPPVSLLPLAKPDRPELRKSLFLSFVNEGDPVARAGPAYVRTLLALYAAPAPPAQKGDARPPPPHKGSKSRTSSSSDRTSKHRSSRSSPTQHLSSTASGRGPVWPVPPATLSNPGRIVVLRSGNPKARVAGSRKTVSARLNDGVVAQIATDEQLRAVVWGDPVAHLMRLYAGRIETLAVGAVTAKGY